MLAMRLILCALAAAPVIAQKQAPTQTCAVSNVRPTPTGTTCGLQGRLIQPRQLRGMQADVVTCRDTCLDEDECLSWSFTKGASFTPCILYSASLATQGFQQSTSQTTFYDRSCFSCKCPSNTGSCGGNKCSKNCLCKAAQTTYCPTGGCVNLQTAQRNCGKCGNVCPSNAQCQGGKCVCGPNQAFCNGKCVLTISNTNCGGCGNTCSGDLVCSTAKQCVCPNNQTTCSSQCTQFQDKHTECTGTCKDTRSDPYNCGSCGSTCFPGATCSDSQCICAAPKTACFFGCYDLSSDNDNCGSCSTACASGESCQNGVCVGGDDG